MAKKLWVLFALLVLLGGSLPAQQFPPGFVDPAPLLAAASKEIGEANLRCVTFSGTGYAGAVGQTFEQNPNVDWRRQEMANYTRTINWETGTSKETFDRKPGENPAAYKYGLGWQDGTPMQKNVRQTFVTNGKRSWAIDGDGPPVEARPEDAEIWQLDLWLNPPGFLKAARMPGANPRAFWRWEQLEMGRDGNVVNLKKMHVVAITMLGKYRVDATINQQNQIQRLHVMVNEPALGDFNIEHESTESDACSAMSSGRSHWHSHQGWDDNFQFANLSTGHNAYGGKFPKVAAERLSRCGSGPREPAAAGVPESLPGHRRKAGQRRVPARWRARQQLHGRVQGLGGGVRGADQREAQPGGHRGSREAGAQQADSLAGQLSRAFRPHRRASHLPAHRLDDHHAPEEHRISSTMTC